MEILENICKLYSEINMIYIELHKLEMNGNKNKNNNSFYDLIKLLKRDLNLEKKFVEDILSQDVHSLEEVIDILDECTDRPFSARFEDYVLNLGRDDLSLKMTTDKEMLKSIKYSILYDTCDNNLYLMYLSFLQEYADSKSFDYLRDKLLNYKYYNAFLNHGIEKLLVDSSFDIKKFDYLNFRIIADMLGLDDGDDIILECCMNAIRLSIKNILSINDDDYLNDDNKVTSINNQCMLRAGLVIVDDKDYDNIKEELFKEFEFLCTDENKVGVDVIKFLFSERVNDKKRVKMISLKKEEN